ncbi:MAG: FAD-dependent oxidoreductase [Solirubrobacteraceae bacterium]|nr:FAD-dependent oxidoreductase [Solirubrobacteraceae bacterium]
MFTRRAFVAGALATTVAGCGASRSVPSSARRVIVVGAGLAGLGAASALREAEIEPVVLEARARVGGRVAVTTELGPPVDLGAAWIHDPDGNPLTEIAQDAGLATAPTDYDRVALRRANGRAVTGDELDTAYDAYESVTGALASAAEEEDPNLRVAPVLAGARSETAVAGVPRAAVDWMFGNAIPLDYAADASELSVLGFDEGETYDGGDDLLLRDSAFALVRRLARGVMVRRSTPVARVERSASGAAVVTREGSRIRADGVVVTVPLGVLQAGAVAFDPPLPAPARRAIERLGFGTLEKVLLRYPEPWWPEDQTQLGTVGGPIGRTISASDLLPVTEAPILAAFVGASYARRLAQQGERAMAAAVTERLAAGFGPAARDPDAVVTTRWSRDPWTRGAYSFLRPGSTSEDRAALGARAGRLILAGEHTSVERPSTMDGAWRSGRAAGREMASALGV